jgi:hypothetical protein
MGRAFIARWARMRHCIARLSASESLHLNLFWAAFITNIAESEFSVQQYAGKPHVRFCAGACDETHVSQPSLSKSCSDFSATFTTIAFDDSSLRWLEINT